eukprot:COSAG06_NODE_9408_length_1909_cov_1.311602_2_plen_532_part_01
MAQMEFDTAEERRRLRAEHADRVRLAEEQIQAAESRARAAAAQAHAERTDMQRLQDEVALAESRRISALELKLRLVENQAAAASTEIVRARHETETELATVRAEAELFAAEMARTNASEKAEAAQRLRAAEERAAKAAAEAEDIRSEMLRTTSTISSAAVKVATMESHVREVQERASLVLKTEQEETHRVREEAREAVLAVERVAEESERTKLHDLESHMEDLKNQTEASILEQLEDKFSRRLEESVRAAISSRESSPLPELGNASSPELQQLSALVNAGIEAVARGAASEVVESFIETSTDSTVGQGTLEPNHEINPPHQSAPSVGHSSRVGNLDGEDQSRSFGMQPTARAGVVRRARVPRSGNSFAAVQGAQVAAAAAAAATAEADTRSETGAQAGWHPEESALLTPIAGTRSGASILTPLALSPDVTPDERQRGALSLSVATHQVANLEERARDTAADEARRQLMDKRAKASKQAEIELKAAQERFKADSSFTNLLAVQALLQKQTRSYFELRRALSPTRSARTFTAAE